MPDRSRRTQLRESTSQAHASLDRMVGSFDSLSSHRQYLRAIAAFRRAVEGQLAAAVWPGQISAWHAETLSELIAHDLQDLHTEPAASLDLPEIGRGTDARLGVLYVVEGSALGSRVLYRRAQLLGLGAHFGARHLAVQSRPSDRWPAFLALLENADAIDMDHVARASRATFQAAEQAFRQVALEPALP